jgi:GTP:adenosylcobinamide-phosphate guanylyltransferase
MYKKLNGVAFQNKVMLIFLSLQMTRISVVDIATKVRVEESKVQDLLGARGFCVIRNVQTSYVTDTVFCLIGMRFLHRKTTGAWC